MKLLPFRLTLLKTGTIILSPRPIENNIKNKRKPLFNVNSLQEYKSKSRYRAFPTKTALPLDYEI